MSKAKMPRPAAPEQNAAIAPQPGSAAAAAEAAGGSEVRGAAAIVAPAKRTRRPAPGAATPRRGALPAPRDTSAAAEASREPRRPGDNGVSGAAAPPERERKQKIGGTPAAPRRARPRAVAEPRSRYTRAEVEAIFEALAAARPEPKSELEYHNPFTLLVAVVLSAQATDAGVNKATRALFARADTPATMLALGEDAVRDHIRTIGLFRNKTKNVIALSRALIERHSGEVPADREALERLPGVGRKTASVVLNVAFGQPTIAVDTHIFRLGNRLGLAPGATPEAVEAGLERIVPARFKRNAHHWLILHGRHTCKARRPLCERCVIAALCKSPEKHV